MCGIIGFCSKNKTREQLDLLYALMQESSIRGLHAFGVAYESRSQELRSKKWFEFPSFEEATSFTGGKLIFHNRYSTSGDWHDMNNNQPIVTSGRVASAVNGVLSMKPVEEYEEEFGIRCSTQNDAEIFNRLLEKGMTPIRALRKLGREASFAGVFLLDGELFCIRNRKRPLYYFNHLGAYYIVSTLDIAIRALVGEVGSMTVVPPFTLIDWT